MSGILEDLLRRWGCRCLTKDAELAPVPVGNVEVSVLFDYLGAGQFGARSWLERFDVVGLIDLDFLFNCFLAVLDALTSGVYVFSVVCRVHAHERLLLQFHGATETGPARGCVSTGSYGSGSVSRGPGPYCFRAGRRKLDSLTSALYRPPRRSYCMIG